METMNKLGANMQCIKDAEDGYIRLQQDKLSAIELEALGGNANRVDAHVDLAAG